MGFRKLILSISALIIGSAANNVVGEHHGDHERGSNVAGYFVAHGDLRPSLGVEVCSPDAAMLAEVAPIINDAQFEVLSFEDLLDESYLASSWLERRLQNDLVDYAKNFIGTRYRRGAKGPKAFDCSGFTSYVFRKFGYNLSPASHLQGTQGESIKLDEVRPGDLIFFSGRGAGSRVGHVGMVVDFNPDNGVVKFIHASTSKGVRIDNYPDGGYYSRRFIGVRRVIGNQ